METLVEFLTRHLVSRNFVQLIDCSGEPPTWTSLTIKEEIEKGIALYETECITELHDPLSMMDLETIRRIVGEMLGPSEGVFVTEGKVRQVIMLIANLAARLQDHQNSLYNDGHVGGGG